MTAWGNPARVLDDLPQWEADVLAEVARSRFRDGVALRVHDSDDYLGDARLPARTTR